MLPPPRLPVLLPVLLVLLLATGCCSGTRVEGRVDRRLSRTRTDTVVGLTGQRVKTPGRVGRSNHGLEAHLRDPQHKDKFIRHLTGPLYFHPKCKKHFHRLYHNTRDCTVPAYYKRCAVLLTQLANSPRCTESCNSCLLARSRTAQVPLPCRHLGLAEDTR